MKDTCYQCETVVTCAAGTSEPYQVGLHQGSAFTSFLCAIIKFIIDSLTENIRKEAHWQLMFADDVVLFAYMGERRAGVGTVKVGGSLGEET